MAGYTGTITDKLGRKIKFVNGVRQKTGGEQAAYGAGKAIRKVGGALKKGYQAIKGKMAERNLRKETVQGVQQDQAAGVKNKGNLAKRNTPVYPNEVLSGHQMAKLNEATGQIPTGKLEPNPTPAPPTDPAVVPVKGKLKFDSRFHFTKDQRGFLSKALGGNTGNVTWKLKKVTEKDVETLDEIAKKINDPNIWRSLNSVANKVDNAAKVGGYAFMPVGTIKARNK